MSDMYAIKTTTLTALGDAVRDKSGKQTKTAYKEKETYYKENYSSLITSAIINSGAFKVPGAKFVKAKITFPHDRVYGVFVQDVRESDKAILRTAEFSFDSNNESLVSIENFTGGLIQVQANAYSVDNATFGFEVYFYDKNMNSIGIPYEVKNTMTPLQMVEEINSMPETPTAEELIITGSCKYRFSNGGWDWFIEKYGDKMTTKNITDVDYMFQYFSGPEIPFDINFDTTKTYHNGSYLFGSCINISSIPKLNGMIANDADNMFSNCYRLRELDYESIKDIDWSYMEKQTSAYSSGRESIFNACYSLRSFPMEFLNHGNPVSVYSGGIFYSLFSNCYALDEVINLPIPHSTANWTSNAFYNTCYNCYRLKNLTFAMPDGAPYVCSKWTKQTIDLTSNLGWCATYDNVTKYNSGITADKRVNDDATYQALKDDPDWYSGSIDYSRYNHDSAVATINSLPDCSAKGGNTIKFKGAAGAKTDGGAINTLTEEEIAVAAAKGWTVSLV